MRWPGELAVVVDVDDACKFPRESTKLAQMADMTLDRIDQLILAAMQEDASIQNQALAEQVNLSASACLKRVRRLRDIGAIRQQVALLDHEKVGWPILVIVRATLKNTSRGANQAFERKVKALPEVLQCYCVAGETDFVLVICARSLPEYQEFAQQQLGDALDLESYSSDIVLSTTKFSTQLPLTRKPSR